MPKISWVFCSFSQRCDCEFISIAQSNNSHPTVVILACPWSLNSFILGSSPTNKYGDSWSEEDWANLHTICSYIHICTLYVHIYISASVCWEFEGTLRNKTTIEWVIDNPADVCYTWRIVHCWWNYASTRSLFFIYFSTGLMNHLMSVNKGNIHVIMS